MVAFRFHQSPLTEAEKEAIDNDVERHGWPQHRLTSESVRAPKLNELQALMQFELANFWAMNPFECMDEQDLIDELSDAINRSHIVVYEGEYGGTEGRFMLVAWSLATNQYALYFLSENSDCKPAVHLIKQDYDLYSQAYP